MNDNQNNNNYGGAVNNVNNNNTFSVIPNSDVVTPNIINNENINNNNIVNQNTSVLPNNIFSDNNNAYFNTSNESYKVSSAVPNANSVIPNVNVDNNTENTSNSISQDTAVGVYDNRFINQDSYEDTNLNNLNIDGTYNNLNKSPDYINEPTVRENIAPKKKNTVPISKELKTVFIIAIILFVFILIMPMLGDLINNIRFN